MKTELAHDQVAAEQTEFRLARRSATSKGRLMISGMSYELSFSR
jgi:hypothetical protein